jgi:tRNA G10  N-methylase Trm11
MSLIALFGRQPELGLAELESVLGADCLKPIPGAAIIEKELSEVPFFRLGGTIKLGTVLTILETTQWFDIEKYLVKACAEHSVSVPEGKLTIGLSAYGFQLSNKMLERTGLSIKKAVKATGRPVRLVPNKDLDISAAQILHNKLTHENGWDLIIYRDGNRTILARTAFVQDIEGYSARDQARPNRDARVGMLPPKLAQIIVNLATGQIRKSDNEKRISSELDLRSPNSDLRLLDPFCGTGVILQEASLMNFSVYGTDNDARMVDYTAKNLVWLQSRFNVTPIHSVEVGDALRFKWQQPVDAVATEVYLGKPMSGKPEPKIIREEIAEVQQLLKNALRNLAGQLKPGTPCCFAIPAWFYDGKVHQLPLIDQIEEIGYNLTRFRHVRPGSLIYRREGQIVGRQLLVVSVK